MSKNNLLSDLEMYDSKEAFLLKSCTVTLLHRSELDLEQESSVCLQGRDMVRFYRETSNLGHAVVKPVFMASLIAWCSAFFP
ncbi:hypothetical protein RIF29_13168 [Crotalaria pallida]|uniref:Uncharacterized protein n=1 Tax=Crotalaria pallida TaxID=3830 RepID=A0AAN9IP95_CROPI